MKGKKVDEGHIAELISVGIGLMIITAILLYMYKDNLIYITFLSFAFVLGKEALTKGIKDGLKYIKGGE